jgi:hypothetical protein
MYIGRTVPFANPYLLQIHFDKHGHKFGATSETDYERMADAFMSQPPRPDLYDGTCVNPRPNGVIDRLRLEGLTLHFGVAFGVDTVRTFHPKSQRKVVGAGGPRAFVDQECLEIF